MKPISMGADSVQGIKALRKTMTRRVVMPQPERFFEVNEAPFYLYDVEFGKGIVNPRYQPGDILWVRETWAKISDWTDVDPSVGVPDGWIYKADWDDSAEHPKWRSPYHMPRVAARLFLRVTDVKVERVQDITEDDAMAEGAEKVQYLLHPQDGVVPYLDERHGLYRDGFHALWDNINAKRGYGWDTNPWVWAYTFHGVYLEADDE